MFDSDSYISKISPADLKKKMRTFNRNLNLIRPHLTEEEFKRFYIAATCTRWGDLYNHEWLSCKSILNQAFYWPDTLEGKEYWANVFIKISRRKSSK